MKQYLDLLKEIQEKGTYKPAAREGMPGTQSLFGYQFRHNLADGFPLLTIKEIYWKGVVVELLWFLRGDTNIKYLVDNNVNIWNEDAYNYYLKKCKEQNLSRTISFELFVNYIKNAKSITELEYDSFKNAEKDSIHALVPKNYRLGDCGFQYGKVWREWNGIKEGIFSLKTDDLTDEQLNEFREAWQKEKMTPGNSLIVSTKEFDIQPINKKIDQIANLINGLKNNPESRRHIVTAIDPAHDQDLALYWCHAMFQFNCRPLTFEERTNYVFKNFNKEYKEASNENGHKGKFEREWLEWFDKRNYPKYYLDCQLYQRSADVVLGVPFNIASYALLTEILAKICNMIPGEFIHTFGDVHIYDNHKEAVEEQLKRTPTKLPRLELGEVEDDFEYLILEGGLNYNYLMEKLVNYNPQSKIKAKLSTGLK